MSKVLSGFQKEVLALYRTLLREAVKKDGASFSETVFKDGTSTAYARREFRKQATEVKRSDFKTIEYKMRKAQKQIKLLQMPGVKVVGGAWEWGIEVLWRLLRNDWIGGAGKCNKRLPLLTLAVLRVRMNWVKTVSLW